MEETVLNKAFAHRNEDGSFLTYGCTVVQDENGVRIVPYQETAQIISNF